VLRGLGGLVLTVGALAAAPVADAQRPPPLLLESRAGTQRAAQETYCVSNGRVGACADFVDVRPQRLSVVRPGELVTIRLPRSEIIHESPNCHPRCEAGGFVYRLRHKGRILRRFELTSAETEWRVRLRDGSYELEAYVAYFETADGLSGQTSGSFGLLVSKWRPLRIVSASRLPAS
jgi:hypothetical protein